MTFDAFLGPSYKTIGSNVAADRSINLYPEQSESGVAEKSPRALLGTPGLSALTTLGTTPVRGIWTGLADNLPGSSAADLLYAVGGSKLYSIVSNGTATLVGDVGDDATHSPVQFVVNGSQLLISSAGLAWVDDAAGLSQVYYNNGAGTLTTAGTAVTWISGDQFDATLVNSGILISGVAYRISAFVDATHITLASTAGNQTAVAYTIFAGVGVTINTSGTAVTAAASSPASDFFTGIPAGSGIVINGVLYTVASVTDSTHLTLTGSAGTQTGVVASYPRPVLAAQIAFLDTYAIALPPNSRYFYISASYDFRTWSPLDFGRKEGFPDVIGAILADHEELWLLGSETSEVWRDTGNADFPFQRDPGAFIHQGIRSPFSVVNFANGVAWIGGDARGNPIAWMAQGYTPVRISTFGVETAWMGYSTITDATSFVYTMRGHQFWVINFPTGNATWVYDATTGAWHERAWWNGSSLDRMRGATHGYVFGKHLVGDWSNGKIYDYSESYYSDDGTAIHYQRTAPHLSNEELWTFASRFRLSMKAGPSPTLAWSDDLGATVNAARAASTRTFGGTSQNSEWRRLGKYRDRVYQMAISSTTSQIAIDAAYIDTSAGGG